jgi:hypothetical protein
VGDETHATRIVLVGWVIQALGKGRVIHTLPLKSKKADTGSAIRLRVANNAAKSIEYTASGRRLQGLEKPW